MVFSRLSMLYFWTFCFFANVFAQQLTSTLPASNRTCPGTRITFNCSTTGSVSVTSLIIAWSSPEYIGQGTFLQFTTDDMMGDSETSMINADVIAQLVYNGDRNGIPTLESQLQLTVSSDLLSSTVSCRNENSGTLRSITFYILIGIPGRPQNAQGTEVPRVDDRCVIFLTWDAPLDYDEEDIDHYIVQSPSQNNIIQTNTKAIFVSISITRCQPDTLIIVSAVDRCGREGTNAVIVPHLDLTPVNKTAVTQQVTTPRQENRSGPDADAVIAIIVIAVIASILTMLFAILLVILICYFRKRLRDHRDIELQKVPTNLDNQLLTLCSNGCTAEVGDFKSLLDQGVVANIQDEGGRHPLWYASCYGIRDLVELFLQYKADVNLKTKDGERALHPASSSGNTDLVKLLVDSGSQIDNEDKDGRTALHCASSSGHTDVVELLVGSHAKINKKDKDGRTALQHASSSGHTDVVKLLVGSHAKIDNKDKDGQTALHLASISGHTDVVKLLVDSGAQIDNNDEEGCTALHLASSSGHTDVVKLLVDSGAQIDNEDEYGRTALHHASNSGHTDVVKLLVDSGVQIDNEDKDGFTPLYAASRNGHKGVVELLLNKGADIHHQTEDGRTALHRASSSGHTDVVKLLVDSGVQIDNEDKYGRTALHHASSSGHTDVVKLLVDSRAQIDKKDKDGRTELHCASNSGHTNVVKLLVDSGAQIDNNDEYGQTALDLASKSHHTGVVKLLVDSGAQIDNKKVVKSSQITDPDRLFNDLSDHIGGTYLEIGFELNLTYTNLVNELEVGSFQMKPASEKAIKMLHLWKESVTEEKFTYAVLAAALERHGLKRCAEVYCYTTSISNTSTAKPE